MRLKVVDMYTDGDLECYGEPSHVNDDNWYRVSQFNVCRAFGIDPHDENRLLSNEQLLALLKGKEFDCRLITSGFIASSPTPATKDVWVLGDVDCKNCDRKICRCGNYEPMEAEHV